MTGTRESAPRAFDTIVVGGGTAGAALANRLVTGSARRVLLLEAGPDYGPRTSGRWPAALLDYTVMPTGSHSWDYRSACAAGTPDQPLDRARVIGGCSSHNGCAAVWGHRADYDAWAAAGNRGWDTAALLPLFKRVNAQLRVEQPTREEITPWHRACVDAGPAAGFPVLPSVNDVDAVLGITIGPINVAEGVRWNTAFAYLDPIRDRDNLTIRGDALVDRVVIVGGRAVGVEIVANGARERIEAGEVVLCAGAYGSPLILQRSGIGDPDLLARCGIPCLLPLPGVGANLQDHTSSRVVYGGTESLVRAMDDFVASGGAPREEGTIVLARSALCQEAFDLHLYPIGSPQPGGGWRFGIWTAIMSPRSRGSVTIASRDPEAPPIIDHAYFGDDAEHDLDVLADGMDFARTLGATEPLASLAGPEIEPGLEIRDREAIKRWMRVNSTHDYHPAGSCAMGLASDPMAVVDNRGAVHGLSGLLVADAAIMPIVPRANTNLPAAVVGERIAAFLLDGD